MAVVSDTSAAFGEHPAVVFAREARAHSVAARQAALAAVERAHRLTAEAHAARQRLVNPGADAAGDVAGPAADDRAA
ncbi:hypothetical protein AB0368_02885 [Actinoplanes sp. NPDC051475]|uniref:hypothetical protein n=1 Tax=Actinoplanes sp. NPDC051475 TaxID=3157225 RepID=UPI00344E340B